MINKYQVLDFVDTLDAKELDLLLQQLLITYESKRGGSDEVELPYYVRREHLSTLNCAFGCFEKPLVAVTPTDVIKSDFNMRWEKQEPKKVGIPDRSYRNIPDYNSEPLRSVDETKHPIPDPPPPPALRVLKGDKVVGVNSCACGTWKNLWLCKPEDCKCGFYRVGKGSVD